MKTPASRFASALLPVLVCFLLAPRAQAAGQARAEYRNLTSAHSATQLKNPGVAFFGGYFNTPGNPQTGAVVRLQECSFGQAFSQWYPSDTYGTEVVASVKAALYPSGGTRATIIGSGKPFRYKWLLYSGTGTDVTSFDATSIANWFTQTDRDAITTQIGVLKAAVAASPLDISLRDALLDIYYDLAVAEMQAAKPKLANLAKYHLGLLPLDPDEFIIDKEIETYGEIVTAMDAAIAQYSALFTASFPDIDPSSFDSTASLGAKMGRYLFIREQPRRNSTPSKFANTNGIQELPQNVISVDFVAVGSGYTTAPTVTFSAAPAPGTTAAGLAEIQNGAVTKVTITTGGSYLVPPTVTFSAAPGGGTTATGTPRLAIDASGSLFTGYKDLDMLFKIIGQRQQHLASAARLRGTRQGADDISTARQSLNAALSADATTVGMLKSWFPAIFPPALNALTPAQLADRNRVLNESGLLASLSAVDSGRIEMANVTGFLNGSANVLGYDPEFLLLVQDTQNQSNPRESFDTLRSMLKESATNSNKPLNVALAKLGTEVPATGAKGLYLTFQEKVDRTATDIDEANGALADRFFAITGFEPGENPGFDFEQPNPRPGSELRGVLDTIAQLDAEAALRALNTAELDSQFKVNADGTLAGQAVDALNSASSKKAALEQAAQSYKSTTGGMYQEMIGMSAGAAASQALYDVASDAAGLIAENDGNPVKMASTGVASIVVGVAGATNVAMQTAAATVIGQNERNIDYAGIDFTVATAMPDAILAANQARQELSSLKREQVAHKLDLLSNTSARLQTAAQASALKMELTRVVENRDAAIATIRKKSYADPLHYHRAEYALIDADESFRTAQRWMFYTLQALNYKWHGKFALTQGSKSYDTATLFKCRNAQELDDLLTQMDLWNAIRVTQTTGSQRIITRISLRDHILSRNPRRFYAADPSDPGTRVDDTVSTEPLPTVETVEHFRNVLTAKYTEPGTGDLVIPFSTAFRNEAPEQVDGSFFRGATYNAAGAITSPGFWREKIEYVKVKILAKSGAANAVVGGAIDYGGITYFHTRVPPRGDRTVAGLNSDDARGELMVAPFRFWESPDFNDQFVARSAHRVTSENIPCTATATVITYDGNGNGSDNAGPPIGAFTGRSIAASGWNLRINRVTGTTILDVNAIDDIEFLIAYKHSNRVLPPP
jgi:hypothetical protein